MNKKILKVLLVFGITCGHIAFGQSLSFSRSDIDTGLSLSGAVIVGDFDSDGKPDILVGEYAPPRVTLAAYLMFGNGDGTFKPPMVVITDCCSGLTAADVNGDAKLDILYAAGDSQTVLLGNGDGTFREPKRSPGVASPFQPMVMDFNGDGNADLAFVHQDGGISVSFIRQVY